MDCEAKLFRAPDSISTMNKDECVASYCITHRTVGPSSSECLSIQFVISLPFRFGKQEEEEEGEEVARDKHQLPRRVLEYG